MKEIGENLRRCLFMAALLAPLNLLYGQPSSIPTKDIIFSQLPAELGLSQNSINCILQDREGFLWIGTWSGLIRYDAYSTKMYHAGPASDDLKSDKITEIYEDHTGQLWVGTQMEGLFRFDKSTEKFSQFKNTPGDKKTLSNNTVWCIQEDNLRNLWVGTENGLNLFDWKTETFKVFRHDVRDTMSISDNHISDLHLSKTTQQFWLATGKGVNLLKGEANKGHFRKYLSGDFSNEKEFAESNFVFKIGDVTIGGVSSTWFCTARGLNVLENGKITNFKVKDEPLSFNTLLSMLVIDGPHPYIITGSEKGLNFFDPMTRKFTRFLSVFDQHLNLSHPTVTALSLDRGGVLWVGTKKGLNKLDSYSKNFESYATSLFDKSHGIITGIRGGAGDTYWVSTLGGGLYRFKDKKFTPVSLKGRNKDDFSNTIQTLYRSGSGSLWLGTAGDGLYRFHESDFALQDRQVAHFDHFSSTTSSRLSGDFIMSITEDRMQNLWVGTWDDGLNKISPEGNITVFKLPLLTEAPLVTMYADREGTLWIGTRGNGLYKVIAHGSETLIRRFHSADGKKDKLGNNFVNAICEDRNGLLWIGTEGGVYSFDTNTEVFKPLELRDNAATKSVTSIVQDDHGKLWLARPEGIEVVDPLNVRYLKKYDYHDRILGGFFYNNVSFKDRKGRIFFGGAEGLNIIEPDILFQTPAIPQVVISDFQLFGKSIRFGGEGDDRKILKEPLSSTARISLRSKENSISFEFAALDYAAPEKISYAYKLAGFDHDWQYTTYRRRFAVYTNLGEGTYHFSVKAANSEGIWNGPVNELTIVIDPPWWKTLWAMVGYVLGGSVALYLFRKLILLRANFRHELKLERLQRENMEKLNHAKLTFFTNISHEFRTPLTLILGPLQNLIDGRKRDKKERDQLMGINNNANRLLRLVNQLLDFRKAESGNLRMGVQEGNIVSFIREIKLSFDGIAENLKINFQFDATVPQIKAWFDADLFEKIMFNLLSNAFKNTAEGGTITLYVSEEKEFVVVAVEDDGKGIKREHFENIFQSFFSYDADKYHTGTGLGLAFVKTLVGMHHGELDFESVENVRTRFVVKLRQGSSHFDLAELSPLPGDVESMDYYPALAGGEASAKENDPEEQDPVTADVPLLLIVEDNDEVRAYVRSIFADGFTILEAPNGEQGLALAVDRIPDIVISDVMMPVMDGIKFCAALKTNRKTSHVPIILLTARTSLIFKAEGLETGADDYITKPFNPKLLKLKVRNLMHTRDVMRRMFQDRKLLNIEPRKVTLTPLDEIFVKNALGGIEENMSNSQYGVDQLARDVGMSRTQLYRKLKALTGQSPNEFIRNIRLKRAAQLLDQNQLTIAEITHKVGFTDLQYFRDCFKKQFGVVPSEYLLTVNNQEEQNSQ